MDNEYRQKFAQLMINFQDQEEYFQNQYENQLLLFNKIKKSFEAENVEKTKRLILELIEFLREQIMTLEDFRIDLTDISKSQISYLTDQLYEKTRFQEANELFMILPHNIVLEGEKILNSCIKDLNAFVINLEDNSKLSKKEFITILRKYSFKKQKNLDGLINKLFYQLDTIIEKLKQKSYHETKDIVFGLLICIGMTRGFMYFVSILTTPKVLWISNILSSVWTIGIFSELNNHKNFKKYLNFLKEYFGDEEL